MTKDNGVESLKYHIDRRKTCCYYLSLFPPSLSYTLYPVLRFPVLCFSLLPYIKNWSSPIFHPSSVNLYSTHLIFLLPLLPLIFPCFLSPELWHYFSLLLVFTLMTIRLMDWSKRLKVERFMKSRGTCYQSTNWFLKIDLIWFRKKYVSGCGE